MGLFAVVVNIKAGSNPSGKNGSSVHSGESFSPPV